MYDETIKDLSLTSDEVDLLKLLLEDEVNNCLSLCEELTVKGLLDKLN